MDAIVIFACIAFVWIMYHKLFDVIYVNFFKQIIGELFFSVVAGSFLAAAIMMYWYISIPIIVIAFIVWSMLKKV